MADTTPETVVTAKLTGKGMSHARTDISARDLVTILDEPKERGGTNLGLSPTETAFAALVGCTNVIASRCADKLGVDIGHTTISFECDFDRRGVMLQEAIDLPFIEVRMRIETDGPASQADVDRVAAEVAKFCPVSRLFTAAGTTVKQDWVAKS